MNSEPEQKPWQTQDWSGNDLSQPSPPGAAESSDPQIDDPWIGKILDDRYLILEVIGRGGMGCVYKGRHLTLNTTVAVKVMSLSDSYDRDRQLARFEQEAKAASKVRHKHLTTVSDYGRADQESPYLVMDFVVGNSLAAELEQRGRLNPIRAMRIFMQICEGMEAAHNCGIIHRDLKPSNIILAKDTNGEDFVRIVDFGIAKLAVEDNEAAPKLTQTGEVFGSPLYMSPEQCLGNPLDRRSDLYSLGCLMYETLNGSPPLVGANAVQTIFKHLNDPPSRDTLEQLRVPEPLTALVLQTLEKQPENRPQSMEAVRKELVNVISGQSVPKPVVQPPQQALRRAAPPRNDYSGYVGMGIAAAIIVALVGTYNVWMSVAFGGVTSNMQALNNYFSTPAAQNRPNVQTQPSTLAPQVLSQPARQSAQPAQPVTWQQSPAAQSVQPPTNAQSPQQMLTQYGQPIGQSTPTQIAQPPQVPPPGAPLVPMWGPVPNIPEIMAGNQRMKESIEANNEVIKRKLQELNSLPGSQGR